MLRVTWNSLPKGFRGLQSVHASPCLDKKKNRIFFQKAQRIFYIGVPRAKPWQKFSKPPGFVEDFIKGWKKKKKKNRHPAQKKTFQICPPVLLFYGFFSSCGFMPPFFEFVFSFSCFVFNMPPPFLFLNVSHSFV